MECKRYYARGKKVTCHECESEMFGLLAKGKGWNNLECENGHFQTIYSAEPLKTAAVPFYDDGQKVKIVRHEITITATKYITLYLPEDEDVEDHLDKVRDRYEYDDEDTVAHDRHTTKQEYDAALLYDEKGQLRDAWNAMDGELTGFEEERTFECQRPEQRLETFSALSPTPQ